MNFIKNLFSQKTTATVLAALNKVLTALQDVAQRAAAEAATLEKDLEKARAEALQADTVAKNIQTLLNKNVNN